MCEVLKLALSASASRPCAHRRLRRPPRRSILIARMATREKQASLKGGRKQVLVVLFVPSVERDGATSIDQQSWVTAALEMFGRVFGGATAYPRARGVWRDDERGGTLVMDEPVVIHCYTIPKAVQDDERLAALGAFCRRMGREAHQGEIGLVIGDEYFAIRDFTED